MLAIFAECCCLETATRAIHRKARIMSVAEELDLLKGTIAELEEKYCQNCQEWDCDYCWANADDVERRDE